MWHAMKDRKFEIDLDHMDFDYFKKDSKGVRKDGTLLDDETTKVLEEISNNQNPFEIEMPFAMSEFSQSKFMRASIKAMKENPEILKIIVEEVGVENL